MKGKMDKILLIFACTILGMEVIYIVGGMVYLNLVVR